MRAALLVSAALAGVFLAGRPGYGQAQVQLDVTAQAPPGAPAHTPAENAIPVTPEMIDDLYRRFHDVERKKEEVATELAAPINRQVNVSLAPGAATASTG